MLYFVRFLYYYFNFYRYNVKNISKFFQDSNIDQTFLSLNPCSYSLSLMDFKPGQLSQSMSYVQLWHSFSIPLVLMNAINPITIFN